MLDAALAEQLELRILAMVRLVPETLDLAQLEGREVVALEEADEVRGADHARCRPECRLHAARIPCWVDARWLSADSARLGGEPCGCLSRRPSPVPQADARERDGKDEHQGRCHDAEEDGHGCEDGGEGFSVTFHGSTMAPGRATFAWHAGSDARLIAQRRPPRCLRCGLGHA